MQQASTVSLQNTFLTFAAGKLEKNHRRTKSDSVYTPNNGQLDANDGPLQEQMQNGRTSSLSEDASSRKLEVYAKIFEGWHDILQPQKEFSLPELDNDNSTRPSTGSSTESKLSLTPLQEATPAVIEFSHGRVPRRTDLKKEYAGKGPITTVMLRNIPNLYTQRALIAELDLFDFQGKYDFLYLPFDRATGCNVGYVFINFPDPLDATKCMTIFQDYCWDRFQRLKKKHAKACPAHIQGLENNMRHYADRAVRESKIMQYRPLILPSISSLRTLNRLDLPIRRYAPAIDDHWPSAASDRSRTGTPVGGGCPRTSAAPLVHRRVL
eukprot:GEMP01037535.1.p1 GENE.GEMP01037535.1~~GEMP01037535.1.p1  ORF type:complete len:324 (+),score=49.33 GEMP01037535.1:60-1031(+)